MEKTKEQGPRGRCLSEVLAERLYTRAVKTDAIDRRTDIPKDELDEFHATRTDFIKNRVRLLGMLAVGAYIAVMFGLYLVDPLQVKGPELSGGLLLIVAGGLLLYFNSRADSIAGAKVNAVLFTVLLLVLLVKFGLFFVGAGALMSALVLMVTMFLVAITIPWRPVEVLGIGGLHLATYAVLFTPWIETFHDMPVYNRSIDGGIFLLIGLFLCVIIRLKEEERDRENFVLFKKVERNNTKMNRELQLATRIHRNLIPPTAELERVDIAVNYYPVAYMGGDYARYIVLDRDRVLFTIIDVTGHGVSAALLVNRYHAEFERLGREGKSPGELMETLNTFIMDDFRGTDMYVSGFCGLMDRKSGEMTFSNYGHPPQLVYSAEESKVVRLKADSSFLGIPSMAQGGGENRIPIAGDDRIFLYTDGIIEARNGSGDQYGLEKLEAFLLENARETPPRINTLLISDVNLYREGRPGDDVCMMTIGLKK